MIFRKNISLTSYNTAAISYVTTETVPGKVDLSHPFMVYFVGVLNKLHDTESAVLHVLVDIHLRSSLSMRRMIKSLQH